MTADYQRQDSQVLLDVDAGELTVGNVVAHVQLVVDYVRSKGAPDTAVIRIAASPMFDRRMILRSPLPQQASVAWDEPASREPHDAGERLRAADARTEVEVGYERAAK